MIRETRREVDFAILEVSGRLIQGEQATEFELSVRPNADPKSFRNVTAVGLVLHVKPRLELAVSLLPDEFAAIQSIACVAWPSGIVKGSKYKPSASDR